MGKPYKQARYDRLGMPTHIPEFYGTIPFYCRHCLKTCKVRRPFRVSFWETKGTICRKCLPDARRDLAASLWALRADRSAWRRKRKRHMARVLVRRETERQRLAERRAARYQDDLKRAREARTRERAAWTPEQHRAHADGLRIQAELRAIRGVVARRSIKPKRRAELVARADRTCTYCKRTSNSPLVDPDGNTWEIDHRVPICQGGDHGDDNLVVACRRCNRRKYTYAAPPNL